MALKDLDRAMDTLLDPSVSLDEARPQSSPASVNSLRRPSMALEKRMSRISRRLSRAPVDSTAEDESQMSMTSATYEESGEASFYDKVHEDEIQYQALALWAFEGDANQWQISFSAGDIIGVIDAHPEEDWWIGAKDDQKGYFPRTYVEVIKKDIKVRTTVSENISQLQTSLNM